MIGRLWYPQLDAYDAVRRMAGLLAIWDTSAPPSPERLYIADFYLANPPLLHMTHMSRAERLAFNGLGVTRPEKAFVSFPTPPVLFQKMAEVQREAFRTLSGKGLIDLSALEGGLVRPSAAGGEIFSDKFLPLLSAFERDLTAFLAGSFCAGADGIGGLRRSTGLRRAGQ
ncbi:MAG: hypothetical protein KDJ44_16485 [Rhodoblastus sp.]|nr:hypothetical protein [Rhodoblastus sp.]